MSSDDRLHHAPEFDATLDELRTRIEQDAGQLQRHAGELQRLREDLTELDERIVAHQHGTDHPPEEDDGDGDKT
jgi:uncharacterized coiled-coil protein SlyX